MLEIKMSDQLLSLTISSPHSGDWLHVPPITANRLRLDRIAVSYTLAVRLVREIMFLFKCLSMALLQQGNAAVSFQNTMSTKCVAIAAVNS